ncbi:MAG: ABC transporter permease [Shinella sp.]|uniref:ABC transporter permease n=4 Tax=Shinella sp. TaxID=1870904 RepID=UPI0040353F5E
MRTAIGWMKNNNTVIIFLLMLVVAAFASSSFFTERNLMNVLRQSSSVGILSVGMLFVVLTRGIDLSVGSIAALGAVVVALMAQTAHPGLALLIALLVGAGVGLISGAFIAYLRLPAFVVTLAMMTVARGLALILSKGQPIQLGASGQIFSDFAAGYGLGLPYPVIVMLVIFAIGGVVLGFTRAGRIVTAIGSNEEAVRLSGVNVRLYVHSVYVVSAVLAVIGGVITMGRSGVGAPSIGAGAELDAIAAVVIGGASLMGGKGGVFGTLLGVLTLGLIRNVMNLIGVPGYHQEVLMGIIIITAVLLQYLSSNRAK